MKNGSITIPVRNLNPLLSSMPLLKTAFVLFAASVASIHLSAAQDRPNVLFMAVDDMNDWISVLDSEINAITPNLDRLAASGLNFRNAHTPGTYCAPARTAVFTGQFASTTGFYQYQIYHALHPELVPMQSSFKAAGYDTYGTGKLYNHPEGAIDLRDWSEFHVRTQRQRETGWPMDTWEHGAPLPPQGKKTEENRGAYAQNGLRKWGVLPDEEEGEMADTLRAEWAIAKMQARTPKTPSSSFGAITGITTERRDILAKRNCGSEHPTFLSSGEVPVSPKGKRRTSPPV